MTDQDGSMLSSASNPTGFTLSLPAGWYELDVNPSSRISSINEADVIVPGTVFDIRSSAVEHAKGND